MYLQDSVDALYVNFRDLGSKGVSMIEIADKPQSEVQRILRYLPVGRFDLRSKEDIYATIVCEINGASEETGIIGGRWKLQLSGFIKPRITAIDAKTSVTVATFKTLWYGEGYVELSDGRLFYWVRNRSIPGETWEFLDSHNEPLIKFQIFESSGPLGRHEAHVEVERSAHTMPEISLLAAFGWYLTKLIAEDRE